jgi:hypothetical protein
LEREPTRRRFSKMRLNERKNAWQTLLLHKETLRSEFIDSTLFAVVRVAR